MSTTIPLSEKSKKLYYYTEILENTTDVIYLMEVTPDGHFIYRDVNTAYTEVTGIPHEAVIGRSVEKIENEAFRAILIDKFTSCLNAGGKTDYIAEYPFPTGIRTFHSTLSPMRDEHGRINRIIGIARDITERKKAEESLNKREREFRSLAENIPDNIARWDCEGRYLYVNPIHERTLGKTASEIIGTFVPDHHKAVRTAIAQVVANGEKITVLETLISQEGSLEYHEVSIVPERDTSGQIVSVLGIGRNITDKREQELQLHRTKAKLSAVISTIPDLIWVKDVNGVYMMCNPAFENFFGASCDEIIGKTDYNFVSKEQADFFRQKDAEALAAGEMCINEEEIVFALGGQHALLETRKIPVYNGEEFMGVLGIGRNITESKRLEQEILLNQSRLNEAQKIAKVGNWELTFPELHLTWSDEIYRIFEIDPKVYDPTYDRFLSAIHPDDRELVDSAYSESLAAKAPYEVTHRLLMENGRIKYVHERGKTLYDADGNPTRSIGTVQDITEQKRAEKKIEHMAHHDALTGLPNRILAKERAEQIMAHAKRTGNKAAFLFIDLDGFKAINDSLGHSAGDAMLKTITIRLKECIRESDTISRQGGDEFLMILSDVTAQKDIGKIVEKVLRELEKPFEIATHTLSVSGSIGIALYPDHGESFEVLLQSADTAMYNAKELGKNGYCFYTQQMNHNLIGQFKIQNDLKNALQNGEFVLHYQPQIDLSHNTIIGAEALIRWRHPQLGMIPPMSFIPIAESSGLIVPIGQWVIEEACFQAARWHEMGIAITVAVNISAMQFKRDNLESVVSNALAASKIDPKYLELELTESIIMHDTENTLQCIRNLKALGVQLSIDDFGTGYSSLAYLKRFAVDKLKIDQSFIRDILEDLEDAVIVSTIVQMAKNLNLKTIAEGVETQEIVELITSYGCDEVQGYHFAKPLEVGDFENFYAAFGSETDS